MRRSEILEMDSGHIYEDNMYTNTSDLDVRRMKNKLTAKAAKSTQFRVVLTLGVLLILAFITLVILTIFVFIYYKCIQEEISHLKNNNKSIQEEMSHLKNNDKSLQEEMSHLKNNGNSSCCPTGWTTIGSKCYYLHQTLETWERSREECTKKYSILLILKNKDELDSLLPFLKGDTYWIGLRRDIKDSSRWLWADGTPLTLSVWAEGEPNNEHGKEHCAEIRKNIRSLNDVPCEAKNYSICKALSRC